MKKVDIEDQEFKDFTKETKKGATSNNPVHSTLEGNDLARQGNHGGAIKKYNEAQKQDPIFCLPAKYNTFLTEINSQGDGVIS